MYVRCPQLFSPAVGALVCLASVPARAEDYAFQVFCNGSPVGYHHVEVHRGADETTVDTEVAVDVTLAGIELYRYRHKSHEVWREGKLTNLRSVTDDDGDALSLSVHPAEDGMLLVESNEGSREVPADIMPTSYWNPEVLERNELLDTESGKTLKVTVTRQPDGRYDVSGDIDLQVDYRSGRWNGLKFRYIGADVEFRPDQRMVLRDH